ncbi:MULTISPECIES: BTAD domain-containing putative transcriptional regulator [unclassified Streptomyces]|uniref:ATP-binding protein n=1 Tax=unclassified Streptomyces TaxID=2593676 RepID=UPI0009405E51|nr:BTAD domain-containing putative transcriptional regulator [Streptomyces sp. TSRI0281]OKI44659.1 LuxR family transcriptional regulator [Streptomyces sp. TSRI0281]
MTSELIFLPRVAYRGQEMTAPRLRGLLALLAVDLRAGCSVGRLVEGLWPEALPERPGKAVQVLVSRVRSQWGAELIVSTPTGYRLALDEAQVDSSALLLHEAAGVERARKGDHGGALEEAEAGLDLWDGVVAAGVGEDLRDPVVALRTARAAAHRGLVRTRALALARVGRREEAVGPLAELAGELPRDEEVLAELLRCEAVTAGPAGALRRYDAYRRGLRHELGTDPGAGLKAVHQELLRAEAPVVRHGVPHEPNPLLGRESDIAAVTGLLRTSRVVTVTGPGGLGKTRLAYAVGRAAEQRVVHFVPLAGVTADDDVAGEVASALGVGVGLGERLHFAGGGDLVGAIVGALGSGPVMLVLDNCEQVVHGAADLVRALVSRSRELRVLATSRAPLGLTSESLYALPVLTLATSVELFGQRARSVRPDVELPAATVAGLCRHLDGLPLAVELAAARVRVLPVAEIGRRLRDRFALLRGGARDIPERHRTLHAVVEWSWNLLEPGGRAALRALSVFPGGFTEDAAERVITGCGDGEALFLLEQLADQSLIKAAETTSGMRFHMLETVREFSAARRAQAGEEETVTLGFLAWARAFGRTHHDALFSADPLPSWGRIRAEQDNLVLALRHALARADGPTTAALTAVLSSLWATDFNHTRLAALATETGGPLSRFHAGPEDVETARSAAAVCAAALFMHYGPHAVRQLVTLRRLPPAAPDTLQRALAVVLCATPEVRPPDYARLRELCAADEPLVAGLAECVASYVWEYENDVERALDSARRTLDALGPLRNPAMLTLSHGRISDLCLQTERGTEAHHHLRAALGALDRFEGLSDSIGIRWGLVLACLQRGDVDEAEYWLEQAVLDQQPEASEEFFTPDLAARAEIALARGLTEGGLELWRQAVERMRAGRLPQAPDQFVDPWSLEVQSAALAAHAQHGRLELLGELPVQLREGLRALLSARTGPQSPEKLPVYGTVLRALGLAGLSRGDISAVRMMALAERMRVLREFPTLSAARARQAAEAAGHAAGAAYADAVSEYTALESAELRAAALRAISAPARD